MKLHRNSESIGKLQKRRKATKVASVLLVIFSLTIIFIYFPSFPYNLQQSSFDSPILSSTTASPAAAEQQSSLIPDELCPLQVDGSHLCNSKKVDAGESAAGEKENPTEQNDTILEEERNPINNDTCDLFNGEWVPNPEAPYYYRTENDPCWAIQEHQNCFKYGRPDRDYLKWRWKPDGCELPIFDPIRFFELVRGKSLAFVGDSLARNHMQSLICLLSVIAYPEDISAVMNTENKRYIYRDKNFTISMFWSPYLVKSEIVVGSGRPFKLYLDEFDENWRTQIANFNYVIISAGPWFNRPTYFHENGKIVGCHFCPSSENVTVLTSQYSYKRAFRTAFKAINSLVKDFKGVIFLRTFSPSHFEGGAWDNGGKCNRTRPFIRNETTIAEYAQELYEIQLKELEIAKTEGRRKGVKFRLFDATKSMWLRPDGHPGRYGHPPQLKVELPEDCVHWCLPGPIDSMNDVLLQLLKREEGIHSQ